MTTRPIIAALAAALVLSGCQTPQQRGPFGTTPLLARGIYTQGALGQANRLVDRFEADRQEGGMVAVSADISDCYRTTTRPFVQTIPLRECMILDDFAVKLDRETARRFGVGGGLPFFSIQAFSGRLQSFGGLAGFSDAEVLGGYIGQGASTMFAVLAERQRSGR